MKEIYINIEFIGVCIKMVFFNVINLKENIIEIIKINVGKLIKIIVEYYDVLYNYVIIQVPLLKEVIYEITIEDIIRLCENIGVIEVFIFVILSLHVYLTIKDVTIPPEPDKKYKVPVPVINNNGRINLINKKGRLVPGLNSDLMEKIVKEFDKEVKRRQEWLSWFNYTKRFIKWRKDGSGWVYDLNKKK